MRASKALDGYFEARGHGRGQNSAVPAAAGR